MSRPLLPFLYPCLYRAPKRVVTLYASRRFISTEPVSPVESTVESADPTDATIVNPSEDYSRTIFADKCTISVHAGSGGHGCISFLREKYIAAGPANGGDGGSGGNVYIQAVPGETSLHKLARRGILKAGRGKNGQGKTKGGQRGEDVLIQVPVGTIVREVSRYDPVVEEDERLKIEAGELDAIEGDKRGRWRRDSWILYPASMPEEYATAEFPALPRPRRSNLAALQPTAPIVIDFSKPMDKPVLLAAGAVGGLGNPHFVTKSIPRPKFATKGTQGMRLKLELELKLIADVGFVGMPNAGKSTLLRAVSKSRARVGDWAFTTLQPNIGTVVLDDSHGRAKTPAFDQDGERKTQFSIADIPGLIADAHLDKGLGLGFLRHIERARMLAFVVDLSQADPVAQLKVLWTELREFDKLKQAELKATSETRIVDWQAFGSSITAGAPDVFHATTGTTPVLPELRLPPITSKAWFVVATKADIDGTRERFVRLREYLERVQTGSVEHPAGATDVWKGPLRAIAVSGLREEGVEQIADWTVALLRR